jgi:demethylmenaquinone methyltransferase/2-methoxy-6-polyprenyl-1,4-benzoquinol methylase
LRVWTTPTGASWHPYGGFARPLFRNPHATWLDRHVTRATLGKDPHQVARMFDQVAGRYDITNDILSAGQAAGWRRATTQAVDPVPGERILDLAAGTMTSTQPYVAAGSIAIACDFSIGMLREGRSRHKNIPGVAGDALNLPFADGLFDVVTISFGLRNLTDTVAGLREMARVTRPGGRLVVCEFSTPELPVVRKLYLEYLMKALPEVARKISSNPEAYVYLAESISDWPDQEGLAQIIGLGGWSRVQYRNLTGGVVALHRAYK